ncbi:MAG: patatin-like phospholipase family protein [Candidatus Sungbacteria bacterium]|nr:patatin-like phospholipase family protein [Candidatus Sungbacteria bacterium]
MVIIPPTKTAVICGGGGSVGAFQIGPLNVIEEYDIPVDLGIGVSVGAINLASFFSNRFSTRQLAKEWFSFKSPKDLFRYEAYRAVSSLPLVVRNWFHSLFLKLPRAVSFGTPSELFQYEEVRRVGHSLSIAEAIYQMEPILRLIGKIWAPDLISCPKEFIAAATRVPDAKVEYFSNRDPEFVADPVKMLLAVAASCAIPGVFPSVAINYRGEYREYIDGAYDRPLPVKKAIQSGCNTIIIVRCHSNETIRGNTRRWKPRTALKRITAGDSMKTNRIEKDEIAFARARGDINLFVIEPSGLPETLEYLSFRRGDLQKAVAMGREIALRELAPLIEYYSSQKK